MPPTARGAQVVLQSTCGGSLSIPAYNSSRDMNRAHTIKGPPGIVLLWHGSYASEATCWLGGRPAASSIYPDQHSRARSCRACTAVGAVEGCDLIWAAWLMNQTKVGEPRFSHHADVKRRCGMSAARRREAWHGPHCEGEPAPVSAAACAAG